MEVPATGSAAREAALAGDYSRAVAVAAPLVPGMEPQLEQYRLQMRAYDEAHALQDWRKALRALADARLAARAAGVPALEQVASDRLYELVRSHEVSRP